MVDYCVIPACLSPDECDKYIQYIESLFSTDEDEDSEDNEDSEDIEGYQRLRIKNSDISAFVEQKLSSQFDLSGLYIGHSWFPTKYIRDGGLCVHKDGRAYDDSNESVYTVLIYLNDDFEGGRTVIVNDGDEEIKDSSVVIEPKKGTVLILDQEILHFAEKIAKGVKYILRGDIYPNTR